MLLLNIELNYAPVAPDGDPHSVESRPMRRNKCAVKL